MVPTPITHAGCREGWERGPILPGHRHHAATGTALTGAALSGLRPPVTLRGGGRTRCGGSGARPALWLFVLPPSL